MNREQAKKLLPIIQAFAEGKEIQVKLDSGKWISAYQPDLLNEKYEFRIKPEPEVIYVNKPYKGKRTIYCGKYYAGLAAEDIGKPAFEYIAKKFIEVIE